MIRKTPIPVIINMRMYFACLIIKFLFSFLFDNVITLTAFYFTQFVTDICSLCIFFTPIDKDFLMFLEVATIHIKYSS